MTALPQVTLTSEHMPGVNFTVNLTHLPDTPSSPLLFEAVVFDGETQSAPQRKDLAVDNSGAALELVSLAGSIPSAGDAPSASLQQSVDAFRQAAVDNFAWKLSVRAIGARLDLSTKKMESEILPGQSLTVEVKQIDDPSETLVFEVTVSDGTSPYSERHGIGVAGSAGPLLNPDFVQQAVDLYCRQALDRYASNLAVKMAVSQLK